MYIICYYLFAFIYPEAHSSVSLRAIKNKFFVFINARFIHNWDIVSVRYTQKIDIDIIRMQLYRFEIVFRQLQEMYYNYCLHYYFFLNDHKVITYSTIRPVKTQMIVSIHIVNTKKVNFIYIMYSNVPTILENQ